MESLSTTVLGSEFHTAGAEQRNARFARVVLDDGYTITSIKAVTRGCFGRLNTPEISGKNLKQIILTWLGLQWITLHNGETIYACLLCCEDNRLSHFVAPTLFLWGEVFYSPGLSRGRKRFGRISKPIDSTSLEMRFAPHPTGGAYTVLPRPHSWWKGGKPPPPQKPNPRFGPLGSDFGPTGLAISYPKHAPKYILVTALTSMSLWSAKF